MQLLENLQIEQTRAKYRMSVVFSFRQFYKIHPELDAWGRTLGHQLVA